MTSGIIQTISYHSCAKRSPNVCTFQTLDFSYPGKNKSIKEVSESVNYFLVILNQKVLFVAHRIFVYFLFIGSGT